MSERFIEIGSDQGNRVRLLGHQASPEAVLPHKPKLEITQEIRFNPIPKPEQGKI